MKKTLLRRAFATAVLVGTAAAVACSTEGPSRQPLTAYCHVNTDCNAPLVCAFSRCHTACTTSRDCQPGQRCVASDRPFHVCQLADEVGCTHNSDCPEGQVCGVDLACRDECTTNRDCVSGQLCVAGSCAERTELTDGKLPVRRAEAGTASGGGEPCLYNSECSAPLVCVARSCVLQCRTAADCKNGGDCADNRCVTGSGTLIGPQGGVVSADSGLVTLTVPPGALQSVVSFVVQRLDVWPAGAIGPVFEILPTGLTFDVPAKLELRYAAADIGTMDPEALRVGRAVGAVWTPLPSTVDVGASIVSASVEHLSVYGLVSQATAGDAGTPPSDAGTVGPRTDASIADAGAVDARGTTTDSGGGERDTGPKYVITTFPLSHGSANLMSITAGPDGNLWFTESNSVKQIGRITPRGQITEFPTPGTGTFNGQITTGPDGNLWFAESSAVGRITPAGVATEFTDPGLSPIGITAGPDGNLWFTNQYGGRITRLTPTGTFTHFPLSSANANPNLITTGPDGNLWFTEYRDQKIGRMTPKGELTEFPLTATAGSPWGIAAGPDGNLWFAEFQTTGRIARITPTGILTEFDTPLGDYTGVAVGADGNIWFIDTLGDSVCRITL